MSTVPPPDDGPWELELRVPDPGRAEAVCARLWSLGTTGIAEGDDGLLVAAFADRGAARRAERAVGRPGAVLRAVDPDAWVGPARSALTPTTVAALAAGDPTDAAAVTVRAPWHPPVPGPVTEVVIDPGATFGHGGHPTTRLALAAVLALAGPGTSLLDVGCGSGVLAVAAAVRGAAPVVAVDIDPSAVSTTAANAAGNAVAVDVRLGTVDVAGGPFDVVVANVLAPVLCRSGPALVGATATGGRLVVSGLLVEQRAEVERALAPLVTERADSAEGWAVLQLAWPCGHAAGRCGVAHPAP